MNLEVSTLGCWFFQNDRMKRVVLLQYWCYTCCSGLGFFLVLFADPISSRSLHFKTNKKKKPNSTVCVSFQSKSHQHFPDCILPTLILIISTSPSLLQNEMFFGGFYCSNVERPESQTFRCHMSVTGLAKGFFPNFPFHIVHKPTSTL